MGYVIDIWAGNTVTDWNKVKQSTDLVIIRSQYGSKGEDKKWRNHVAGCKSVGLPFGMYAYGCYVSVEDAKVEADDFLKRIDPETKFLALDVEEDTIKAMSRSGNLNDLAKASQAFIDVLKAAGYKVGFYVSHYLYNQYSLNTVKADFLWIPRYGTNDGTPQIKPAYSCELWQYTDQGSVPGITGEVDLNQLCGKDLNWFIGNSFLTLSSSDNASGLPSDRNAGQPIGTVVITASGVRMREQPSTDSDIIKVLQPMSYVMYSSTTGEDGYSWYALGGGYVRSDLGAYKAGIATVLTEVLNVREQPNTDANIAYKAKKGDTLSVWGRDGEWYLVGDNRWVHGGFISIQA